MLSLGILFLVVFAAANALVWLVFRYSHQYSLLATPNERSSHTEPTPTGGGLAISACMLVAIVVLWQLGDLEEDFSLAILPALLVITLTGWFDDHQHIRTPLRALVYFLSAFWIVYGIGGFTDLNLGGYRADIGVIGIVLAVLGIVWLINLYNFMDGIDGIAAIEAVSTGLFAGILFWLAGMTAASVLCLVLVAAGSGYLVWNWPPARIFMGDVGSCPLGLVFATLAVWSHNSGGPSVYVWLILLSVFIADATYTLVLRIVRSEPWYSAHRTHAYQKLVQMGYTHLQVTMAVLLINVCALWPLAYLAHGYADAAIYICLLTYIALALVWWRVQSRSIRMTLY